jgi:hypothetical protein
VTGAFQSIAASLTEVRGLVEEVGEGSRQQSNAVAQVRAGRGVHGARHANHRGHRRRVGSRQRGAERAAEATMAVVGQLRDLVSGAGRTPKSLPADEFQSQELEQAA